MILSYFHPPTQRHPFCFICTNSFSSYSPAIFSLFPIKSIPMSGTAAYPPLESSSSANGVGLGYGIAIAVSILVLISTIMLASYACVRIKSGSGRSHRRHDDHNSHIGGSTRGSDAATRIRPDSTINYVRSPATMSGGLPGPVMVKVCMGRKMEDVWPEMVLGESKRLPMPNSSPCSICLGEYRSKQTIRCMPDCNHCFHSSCIDQWLRMSPTCPICRSSPATSAAISPVDTPLSELVPLAFIVSSASKHPTQPIELENRRWEWLVKSVKEERVNSDEDINFDGEMPQPSKEPCKKQAF